METHLSQSARVILRVLLNFPICISITVKKEISDRIKEEKELLKSLPSPISAIKFTSNFAANQPVCQKRAATKLLLAIFDCILIWEWEDGAK